MISPTMMQTMRSAANARRTEFSTSISKLFADAESKEKQHVHADLASAVGTINGIGDGSFSTNNHGQKSERHNWCTIFVAAITSIMACVF